MNLRAELQNTQNKNRDLGQQETNLQFENKSSVENPWNQQQINEIE